MLANEKKRGSFERGECGSIAIWWYQRLRSLVDVIEPLECLIEECQIFPLAPKSFAQGALHEVYRNWARSCICCGDAGIRDAGERIGKHEAVNPLWMSKGKSQRIVPADGLSYHVCARDL